MCNWIKAHPELLSVNLFSDEASFTRGGVNNLRNVNTWSHDNPHETSETKFQSRFTVNVWCIVLTPLDYYLCGHMKTLVYETKVDTQAALRDNIFEASEHIRNHPNNIVSARHSLLMRAENCFAAAGGHFEQLL